MLVDSHCHLDYFTPQEISALIERAKEKEVNVLQTICTKLSAFNKIQYIINEHDNIYASVGIHPNEVEKIPTVEQLVSLTKHKKVISIGETGLDYYYDYSPPELQQASFKVHIEASRITNLPLVIHSRNADKDMIHILEKEYNKGKFSAIMHSFSSSKELYKAALELGFYISFSGIVTFKNAQTIQEIASITPNNRILIETDSPYLAPHPNRGKKNEPSFITHTAKKLNELRNCNNIDKITTINFFKLFNKIML